MSVPTEIYTICKTILNEYIFSIFFFILFIGCGLFMLHAPHMLTACTGADLCNNSTTHCHINKTFYIPYCRDVNSVAWQTNYGKRRFTLKVLTSHLHYILGIFHLTFYIQVFVCIFLYMKRINLILCPPFFYPLNSFGSTELNIIIHKFVWK